MTIKRVMWVKDRLDYEPLFSILEGLRLDGERRDWIDHSEIEWNIYQIEDEDIAL